jgi:DNA-binding transcriptional LysR family regulator
MSVVRPWAEAYIAETDAPLPFDLDPRPRSAALDMTPTIPNSLMIFDGPPPSGWFATPLGRVPIVIVVHPDNPLESLDSSDIADLFARRTANWSALGGSRVDVQPVVPLAGESVRDGFEQSAMAGTPIWPGAWLAPTPEAMVTLVASEPGAVGLLLGDDIPTGVVALSIDGRAPGDRGYPYAIELLAFAPSEPTGGLRDWLGWVQARPGP